MKAQVQSNAVVAKDRKGSQNQIYAQVLAKKYCINCAFEVKAQVQSSAAVSKKR